jgi:hypothetical protein
MRVTALFSVAIIIITITIITIITIIFTIITITTIILFGPSRETKARSSLAVLGLWAG